MGNPKELFFLLRLFFERRFFSIVLVSAMLFTLCNFLAAQKNQDVRLVQGLEDYKSGNYLEAIGNLEAALYKNLSDEDAVKANLYLGLSYIAINNIDKGKNSFKSAIKLNPSLELDPSFAEDTIAIFNEVKNDLPIIYQLKFLPEIFFPYRGEKPWMEFNLSRKSDIIFKITNSSSTILNLNERGIDGFNSISWQWSDKLLVSGDYDYSLEAHSSDDNSFNKIKRIALQVSIPEPLKYVSGQFVIPGQEFRQEYELSRSRTEEEKREFSKNVTTPLLESLGCFGLGVAGIIIGNNSKNDLTKIVCALGITPLFIAGVYCAIDALVHIPSVTRSKVAKEPNKENIEYNQKIKEEIDELKRGISVTQKSTDKDKTAKK